MPSHKIYLIRHGETEWSISRQHTGTTDIPLTDNGRVVARLLKPLLKDKLFVRVLTSPLKRARETCELAGLGDRAEIDRDLVEWDYGEYEGLKPAQILARKPGWIIFSDGAPGGESPEQVGVRVDRIIAKLQGLQGDVAVFAHGHLLRTFAARWLQLSVEDGCHFLLDPATLSVASYYRDIPAIERWNAPIVQTGDFAPLSSPSLTPQTLAKPRPGN